jgi:hypothetical protein
MLEIASRSVPKHSLDDMHDDVTTCVITDTLAEWRQPRTLFLSPIASIINHQSIKVIIEMNSQRGYSVDG